MACPYSAYCLGMCEWTDCPGALIQDDNTPPAPHPTDTPISAPPVTFPPATSPTSLEPTAKRFKFASEQQLSELAKGLVPENTSKSTKWALNNFDAWLKARNVCHPDNPVPEDILMSSDPEVHLSRFIVETRKSNGETYPPCILRYMRKQNPSCPNFLDKNDFDFIRCIEIHGKGCTRGIPILSTPRVDTQQENNNKQLNIK